MASECECQLCFPQNDLNKVSEAPTILCNNISLWVSLYKVCCCRTHLDSKCCKISEFGECFCPRCCFCFMLPRKDPLRCDSCKAKVNTYKICKHNPTTLDGSSKYARCANWFDEMKMKKKTRKKRKTKQ